MPIELPSHPKGFDYEDLVSAALISCGYYIESHLILKAGSTEVLEFDAIATPVNDYTNRYIIEVKSGYEWKIGDVFKLFGQMSYTGNRNGWFVYCEEIDDTKSKALGEICPDISITLLRLTTEALQSEACPPFPVALSRSPQERCAVTETAWWGRIADRIALKQFGEWTKGRSKEENSIPKDAKIYIQQIDQSLFKRTPLRRAESLYQAYMAVPKLTSRLLSFLSEGSPEKLKMLREKTWNTHEKLPIQYVMFHQHRARLAIIKNAYDAIIGAVDGNNTGAFARIFGPSLPASFRSGMANLQSHPTPNFVPHFLQVFVEVLGGFYYPDDADDVALVSRITGLLSDQIETSLAIFDGFFPLQNSWIFQGTDGMRYMKEVPGYIRGLGCFIRQRIQGEKWMLKHPTSRIKLSNWHNATYYVLEAQFASDSD